MSGEKREANNTVDQEHIQGKYLTFSLAGQEYGLEILKVKEIIGIMPVTSIPQTPYFVKGVVNLRGRVIPVIDLRLRFGMDEKDYDERTCIIVVEFQYEETGVQMGIIVDSVSEVLNVSSEDIEPTPKFGISVNTNYILGMAKGKNTVRTLLDIDKVLASEEIADILSDNLS